MLELRTIVCAVDFSDIAEQAVRTALELAAKFSATVHLVHVCHPPSFMLNDADIMLPADFHEEYRKAIQQRLDELVANYRQTGVELSGQLREGMPAQEIVDYAHELGADLVVLGTHGHRGLTHLLLGSVAERVVRTARIPVLTVPARAAATK